MKLGPGKRIGDILKENKVATEIPEDLRDLMMKALGLRKHLCENKRSAQQAPNRAGRIEDPQARKVLHGEQETARGIRVRRKTLRSSSPGNYQ